MAMILLHIICIKSESDVHAPDSDFISISIYSNSFANSVTGVFYKTILLFLLFLFHILRSVICGFGNF